MKDDDGQPIGEVTPAQIRQATAEWAQIVPILFDLEQLTITLTEYLSMPGPLADAQRLLRKIRSKQKS